MMPTGETIAAVLPGDPTTDAWRRLRYGSLLLLLGITAAVLLTGTSPSTLGELKAAVAAGRVGEVRTQGGLHPEADGYAHVTLLWQDGPRARYVEVTQVSDVAQLTASVVPDEELIVGSVTDPLLDLDSSLRVVPADRELPGSVIAGWRVPGWVLAGTILAWVAALLLATRGPEPWWATRWAWFWAFFSPAAIVTVPLFLLVSGPPPGMPAPDRPGRRLTGGSAFLLLAVLVPTVRDLIP